MFVISAVRYIRVHLYIVDIGTAIVIKYMGLCLQLLLTRMSLPKCTTEHQRIRVSPECVSTGACCGVFVLFRFREEKKHKKKITNTSDQFFCHLVRLFLFFSFGTVRLAIKQIEDNMYF